MAGHHPVQRRSALCKQIATSGVVGMRNERCGRQGDGPGGPVARTAAVRTLAQLRAQRVLGLNKELAKDDDDIEQ